MKLTSSNSVKLLPAVVLLVGFLLQVASAAEGFYLDTPQAPQIPDNRFVLTDFGGVGDGKTMNTEAFAKAIKACEDAGGGSVVVPAGTFVTGPIILVSKLALVVEKDATIQASEKLSDFGIPDPLPKTQAEYDALKAKGQSLIRGSKLTDIVIRGEGKIDGGGIVWWAKAKKAPRWALEEIARRDAGLPPRDPITMGSPTPAPSPNPAADGNAAPTQTPLEVPKEPAIILDRGNMIVLYDCERIHIQGVTLSNPSKFHFVPGRCKEILVEDIKVIAPEDSPNTDGVDPSNCQNVLIRGSYFDTGDDDIAIKSGKSGALSENITIMNCTIKEGHGISIGSETDAGVRNMLVQDCTFEGTDNGLRIKSDRTRGGTLENIAYRNIQMKDVDRPITIFLFYDDKTEAASPKKEEVVATTPFIKNITFTNITCDGAGKFAGEIIGLPESPALDVHLQDVKISGAKGPFTIQDAKGVQVKNLDVTTVLLAEPPATE